LTFNLKNSEAMKKRIDLQIYLFAITGGLMLLATSCKKDVVPVLITSPVTYVSEQSVTCNGDITDDGGASVTERGVCWSTSHNPTTSQNKISGGSGSGSFTCTITGLIPNTSYYLRAYAISSAGTGYGPEISFRTWNAEMVTDIDGNVYHTVTIGTQVWMVENLKVTRYRGGEAIDLVTDNASWEGMTSGAYCEYDNNAGNVDVYGRLYNWFAVNDNRNIAPEGWHVPSDGEWTSLASYLGGDAVAGGKLKEAGLIHWKEPNTGATNETGFTGLPGGHREYGGNFDYINWGGGWWCATEANPNDASIRYLDYGAWDLWNYLEDKRYGRSVKCVKD
jgi:uncharacterized protein (TIGR02145 family)